jgi:hypothetical protein
MFLEISVDLETALAAEAHLAEGQRLEEQLIIAKLRYVPSRKTNTDCFKNGEIRFKSSINIYVVRKKGLSDEASYARSLNLNFSSK